MISTIFFVRTTINHTLSNDNSNQSWVYFDVYGNKLSFLLDSGATLCAIKITSVDFSTPIFKDKIVINGIGGKIVSQGYVTLPLKVDNIVFKQNFYVFDELPCKTDAIMGHNFLKNFNSIINLETNEIVLKNAQDQIKLTVHQPQNKMLIVPPRCEIIQYLPVIWLDECVVLPNEISDGVFLAGSIVKPENGKIPVKILNTREEEVKIPKFEPFLHKLSEYNICHFNTNNVNVERVKELFSLLKLNYLNKEEQISIENICAKFSDIFHMPGDKLTTTNIYKPSIQLKDNARPVYVKPYRLPNSQKVEVDRQIKQMCANDIIEEAQSEWSSPILIVPKRVDSSGEKKWRIVIDMRLLNQQIKDDKFPLPNANEILDSLGGAIYFSHLDLSQGYYQVELHPESRKYTAFTTNKGQFQMKRLPMGLKISPSTFSRLMTVAMSGLNYEKCFVYLDDLIVFGRNLEDHNKNLIKVFTRLRKVNLKLNPTKCEFLKKELLYLGNVITPEGISPDPEKIRVLKDYPVPQNADEVKRFVAFANYYRKFIPNFAEKSLPLNVLCRKNIPFHWSLECQNSFEILKTALSKQPVLQYPNFSDENEFILKTDASGIGIGAVLANKNDKPIAYASRCLNKAELNYPTIEKELLAIVWAVKHFRPYLYGKKFKILTDHKPLIYLFNFTNPTSRLTKFRLQLEEYDFYVEYIKGKENVVADALSRITLTSQDLKKMHENTISVMTRAQSKQNNANADRNLGTDKTSEIVRPDQPNIVEILRKPKDSVELVVVSPAELNKIKNYSHVSTKSGSLYFVPHLLNLFYNPNSRSTFTPDGLLRDLELISKKCNIKELILIKDESNEKYITLLANMLKNNCDWNGPRICIVKGAKRIFDKDMQRIILNDFHILPTSGHAGINRMTNNIKKYYYWPGMTEDVKTFVKKCDSCQRQKHSKYVKEPMMITTTASYAFQKIYLDIVGPLEKDESEFLFILTLQCELTKYVEAYPLKSKDSVTVAKAFVENFALRYGIPKEIATDRGTEFISSTFDEICKLLNIKHLKASAYHHESIGSLENSHKAMGAYLRMQTQNQSQTWSSWVPFWCFAYNTTVHTDTKYTPFELVFGQLCNVPNNIMDLEPLYNFNSYPLELKYRLQIAQAEARENLISDKLKRKSDYDKSANPVTYKPGDLVLVRSETGSKLSPIYNGPYEVVEELSPNVKIKKDGKYVILHKNRTKMYHL